MANFELNGKYIKNPSKFSIERYNVTTMQRLANASMAGDLIAKKLKFYFTYDAISAYELEKILEAVWYTNELFVPLKYLYNGISNTTIVYVGSIPSDLHNAAPESNWIWKNVTFNLIER